MYDIDRDGYISNGELFLVLKMMVGNNLKVCIPLILSHLHTIGLPVRLCIYSTLLMPLFQDQQLQQIVDKTIMEADQDGDGKLSFDEFAQTVANTVRLILCSFFFFFSLQLAL